MYRSKHEVSLLTVTPSSIEGRGTVIAEAARQLGIKETRLWHALLRAIGREMCRDGRFFVRSGHPATDMFPLPSVRDEYEADDLSAALRKFSES